MQEFSLRGGHVDFRQAGGGVGAQCLLLRLGGAYEMILDKAVGGDPVVFLHGQPFGSVEKRRGDPSFVPLSTLAGIGSGAPGSTVSRRETHRARIIRS